MVKLYKFYYFLRAVFECAVVVPRQWQNGDWDADFNAWEKWRKSHKNDPGCYFDELDTIELIDHYAIDSEWQAIKDHWLVHLIRSIK